MPELRFRITWPDGSRETCYSPSTVIRDHFQAGLEYPMPDFLARCRAGLNAASDRVRLLYGVPCALALGQLARIEATSANHAPETSVFFESFQE